MVEVSKYLNVIFFVLLLFGVFFSINFSFISADAPYYLAVARDISEGLVPYKDISLAYTPVVMYLNSLVYQLLPDPDYNSFLIFQYCIIFICGYILYKIAEKHFQIGNPKARLLSLFFCLAVLSADGSTIVLEVYSVLFVLIALYLFYNKQLLWAGFFLGVSFFCKQYGLFNFLPFYLVLFLQKENRVKNVLLLSAGGLLPLLIFLFYFLKLENINFYSLYSQINGKAYLVYSFLSLKSITGLVLGAKVFILLILPLFFLRRRSRLSTNQVMLITGILVNLIPVALQTFQHYYINTFPFLFVLIASFWKSSYARLLPSFLVSMSIITGLLYYSVFKYRNFYEDQVLLGKKVAEIYPEGSPVFLQGKIRFLYFLNNYKNPLVSRVGYRYLYSPEKKNVDEIDIISISRLHDLPANKIINHKKFKFYVYPKK